MAKVKTKWVCQNCGYETVSYLGRCPECNQFGTFVEEVTSSISKIESSKPSNIVSAETKISRIK
jgi:DNA repair protein RadA/Sms